MATEIMGNDGRKSSLGRVNIFWIVGLLIWTALVSVPAVWNIARTTAIVEEARTSSSAEVPNTPIVITVLTSYGFVWVAGLLSATILARRFTLVIRDSDNEISPIRRLAVQDVVTGLPSHAILLERAVAAVQRAEDEGHRVAVICLDLQEFRKMNSPMGEEETEELLRDIGQRLRHVLRDSDTVARLGQDRFTLLAAGIAKPADVTVVVNKVVDSFSEPFHIRSRFFYVSAKIGVSVYPDDSVDAASTIQHAEFALSQAVISGSSFELYGQHAAS
jgi:diguanylate cyclase (GGDEF)-like protein